jgi:hypothetical protein
LIRRFCSETSAHADKTRNTVTHPAMAEAKRKQGPIPKFSNEAEEALWWDGHRAEIEAEIRQRIQRKRPPTKT